jgi:hypothetical protein
MTGGALLSATAGEGGAERQRPWAGWAGACWAATAGLLGWRLMRGLDRCGLLLQLRRARAGCGLLGLAGLEGRMGR